MDDTTDDERRFDARRQAHYRAVLAYAARRVPGHERDIAAEVFLVAWRRAIIRGASDIGGELMPARASRPAPALALTTRIVGDRTQCTVSHQIDDRQPRWVRSAYLRGPDGSTLSVYRSATRPDDPA